MAMLGGSGTLQPHTLVRAHTFSHDDDAVDYNRRRKDIEELIDEENRGDEEDEMANNPEGVDLERADDINEEEVDSAEKIFPSVGRLDT